MILSRPKQAIHHLLELLIIHVCTLPPDPDPAVDTWHTATVDYLARAAHDLIPSNIFPATSIQWYASPPRPYSSSSSARITPPISATTTTTTTTNPQSVPNSPPRVGSAKPSSQTARLIPQTEESFPSDVVIDAHSIMHVIASVTHQLPNPESQIPFTVLSELPGLMDEPARTSAITYAWFLHSEKIPNGFLRKFIFSSALARRELPANLSNNHMNNVDGRLIRRKEELHSIYGQPFINRLGHLSWYTVRTARVGEVITRPAESYAKGCNVRIHSCKTLSRSVAVKASHLCNRAVLDLRLWSSWTMGFRGIGSFKGLANPRGSSARGVVVFDEPVRMEGALGVGFRIVDGVVVDPLGRVHVVLGVEGQRNLYRLRQVGRRQVGFRRDRGTAVPASYGMLFV